MRRLPSTGAPPNPIYPTPRTWYSYLLDDQKSVIKFAEVHFIKQSWLERRYMSFRLVDEPHPDRCRH